MIKIGDFLHSDGRFVQARLKFNNMQAGVN